jgi:hypothetical protein
MLQYYIKIGFSGSGGFVIVRFQQSTIVYRATIDFVSKVTSSRSIVYEKVTCNIFAANFLLSLLLWLLLPLYLPLAFIFTLSLRLSFRSSTSSIPPSLNGQVLIIRVCSVLQLSDESPSRSAATIVTKATSISWNQ